MPNIEKQAEVIAKKLVKYFEGLEVGKAQPIIKKYDMREDARVIIWEDGPSEWPQMLYGDWNEEMHWLFKDAGLPAPEPLKPFYMPDGIEWDAYNDAAILVAIGEGV